MADPRLIYVADHMCSWCYGFAPELETVMATTGLTPELVLGGLRVGSGAQPLTPALVQYLRGAWQNVGGKSGQPFSLEPLGWQDWVYDTEPACRAAVSLRLLAPGHELAFFARLQRAFYADGRDLTRAEPLCSLVDDTPVSPDAFLETFESPLTAQRTLQDFARAKALGVRGFPTLLLAQGEQITPLTRGYKRARDVLRAFDMLAA